MTAAAARPKPTAPYRACVGAALPLVVEAAAAPLDVIEAAGPDGALPPVPVASVPSPHMVELSKTTNGAVPQRDVMLA